MLLRIFTLIFFLSIFIQLEAQSIKDKLFFGLGGQIGLLNTKATKVGINKNQYELMSGFHLGFNFNLRYNIKEVNENFSVGIGTTPTLGFLDYYTFIKSENFALGGLNIPLEFSINLGEGATYESPKEVGFAFKAGVDMNIHPLFTSRGTSFPENFQKFSAFPHIAVAVRFFGNKDFLQEYFLRFNLVRQPKAIREDDNIMPAIYLRGGMIYFFGF